MICNRIDHLLFVVEHFKFLTCTVEYFMDDEHITFLLEFTMLISFAKVYWMIFRIKIGTYDGRTIRAAPQNVLSYNSSKHRTPEMITCRIELVGRIHLYGF